MHLKLLLLQNFLNITEESKKDLNLFYHIIYPSDCKTAANVILRRERQAITAIFKNAKTFFLLNFLNQTDCQGHKAEEIFVKCCI